MGKGELILVVDEVREQREIASRMLEKLGYFISSVSSGEEAIEYLVSNSVHLLVLDMIVNPGIDGLETYRKALQFNARQKAIIVSGFSETDRVKEGQGQVVIMGSKPTGKWSKGSSNWKKKPVNRGELVSTIEKMLHK